MIKFNLRTTGAESHADVSGTPQELAELIYTIMIENDVCARLILVATEMFHSSKSDNNSIAMSLKSHVKQWMYNNEVCGDNPWFDKSNTYFNLTVNQIIAVSRYLNSCGGNKIKADENTLPIQRVNGWLDFESNKELFNEEAKKNCLCKFECGTVIRYDEAHPMEVMTHFKLACH